MKIEIRLRALVIIILIISILTIIWIDFIPYKLEEWWFGSGDKFEKIIYSLSSSYVGSYVFYFLLVHLKEKNDKRRRFEEFKTHLSLYISNYHKQLKEIISFNDDIITIGPEKPYKLQLENLIYIFEPAKSFSFYTNYSDNQTKAFIHNRTKRYKNYFFALNKLIDCIKSNHSLLDYYEHNEIYELFKVFIILNEEENFEEQFDQRVINKDGDQYLFEKDIEHILLFTGRIKNEPEYAYPLELHSKEYLDLYYRFKLHLELNVNSLRTYKKIIERLS